MDKNSAARLIQEVFQNSFNRDRFVTFTKNLFNFLDTEKNFVYRGNFIPDAYKPYINTLERIGKYEDAEENKIDVLIVHLKKEHSIEYARTMQRNFIAWYLGGSRGGELKDAALVAFYTDNPDDWRFSLVKMDYQIVESETGKIKTKTELTPARRFSFLVGKNENSHTAQRQLLPTLQDDKNNPLLSDFEKAFNIEVVTQEFFERYCGLFLDVKEALEKIILKNPAISQDFTDKGVDPVDFSKKLLGQIVFLYFLQKKGWFGVGRDDNWGTGPKNFLRLLFEKMIADYKNFFNDILEPLFYEALAKERDDDFYSRFNCKIPFLNGGLFDPISDYDWVHTDILLPDELFSNQIKTKEGDTGTGILDIFDRYNFTVKEDEPLEKEVAVDPEMLGKVFENLLEVKDRKSKGTYYTPREIVHYMCQESLINYLVTELNSSSDGGRTDSSEVELVSRKDIEILIQYGESVVEHDALYVEKKLKDENYEGRYATAKLPESVRKNAQLVDDKLKNIRVCDPAIGSGAFPVGMMNEIIRTRNTLTNYLEDKKDRSIYNFKRDAIQNSLYGVDIDPGAVEIAKLRLWLSLVVDEEDIKQIKPLPNLDYKIMQGNSLLEEFEGVQLFDENIIPQGESFKESQIKYANEKISKLQREYFQLHSSRELTLDKRKIIEQQIKHQQKIKSNLVRNPQVGDNIELFDQGDETKHRWEELILLHKTIISETNIKEKRKKLNRASELEWEFINMSLKKEGKLSSLKQLEQYKRANIKPFFLWKLHFSEVFQEKGGFDVVIANPPYIVLSPTHLKSFNLVEGNNNTYIAFLEMALRILCDSGVISYIIPTTWLAGNNFREFRKFLLDQKSINQIVQLPYDIFEAAYIDSLILIINGRHIRNETVKTFKFNIKDIMTHGGISLTDFDLKNWAEDREYVIFLNNDLPSLLRKYRIPNTVSLGTIAKVQRGTLPPRENQLILDSKNNNSKLIPWFSGQVFRYFIDSGKTYWVKYSTLLENKPMDLFSCKKIFGRQLISRQFRLQFAYSNGGFAFKKNLYAIYDLDAKINQYYLLALLNSKFYSYIQVGLNSSGQRDDYPALSLQDYKNFLIPLISPIEQKPFVEIVDKILAITKDDNYLQNSTKQAQVKEYEKQIDQLVYKLYGLTPKEIAIVEGSK